MTDHINPEVPCPQTDTPDTGASLPKCEACDGRGEIGGFDHAEGGYRSEPCPHCQPWDIIAGKVTGALVGRVKNLIRTASDDLYYDLLNTAQDYLVENLTFNIGQKIETADRNAYSSRMEAARLQGRVEALEDALRLILPMAKGYASANRVGSNLIYIQHAENTLSGGASSASVTDADRAPGMNP